MRIYSEPQHHGALHAKLQSGYGLMALGGDIDFDDQPRMMHGHYACPTPTEDVEWKAAVVDAAWTRYRETHQ